MDKLKDILLKIKSIEIYISENIYYAEFYTPNNMACYFSDTDLETLLDRILLEVSK